MKKMISALKNEKGFTVIEILIVTALIAIMSSIAIPSYSVWLPNYRLKSASRDLLSNFQLAKLTSIKKNCNCAITFNQPVLGTTYDYIVFVDADNDLEFDAGEEILTKILWASYKNVLFDTSHGSVNFASNDDGLPATAFRTNGLPVSNTGAMGIGTVYLKNTRDKTSSVILSASGNIRIP